MKQSKNSRIFQITLLILTVFMPVFAQEDGLFIPDEITDTLSADDTLFSVEVLPEDDTADTINNAEVSDTTYMTDNSELSAEKDTVADTTDNIDEIIKSAGKEESIEITETAVEPSSGESKIRPEILLLIDEETQMISFEFHESSKGKTIEIINLVGNPVFEFSSTTDDSSISFSLKEFESGIYIVRILSSETRISIFSKAIVIG